MLRLAAVKSGFAPVKKQKKVLSVMEPTTICDDNLAIYIHVPFCRKRCDYCHFDIKVFHPKTDGRPFITRYLDAVDRELAFYERTCLSQSVSSVFLGGGTPSQLSVSQISRILDSVRKHFSLVVNCEISMELNPEDVSPAYLSGVLGAGVTRISFGVQTFDPAGLASIGRIHSAGRAREAIEAAPHFPHGRSLDLILGLPHQTMETLQCDLDTIISLDMEHVALYMLERDLPTPLDKKVPQVMMPDEDQQAAFYEKVRDYFRERGYLHYEISNFAKPGFSCRHNLTYWRMGDYLGIGPAAHGRLGRIYTANHAQLHHYLNAVSENENGGDLKEHWTEARFNQERIIQGLRLWEGVGIALLTPGQLTALEPMKRHGLVYFDQDRLYLTDKGRLLGNEVFEVFLI